MGDGTGNGSLLQLLTYCIPTLLGNRTSALTVVDIPSPSRTSRCIAVVETTDWRRRRGSTRAVLAGLSGFESTDRRRRSSTEPTLPGRSAARSLQVPGFDSWMVSSGSPWRKPWLCRDDRFDWVYCSKIRSSRSLSNSGGARTARERKTRRSKRERRSPPGSRDPIARRRPRLVRPSWQQGQFLSLRFDPRHLSHRRRVLQ